MTHLSKLLRAAAAGLCLFLVSTGCSPMVKTVPAPGVTAGSTTEKTDARQFIAASDSRFRYEGRFDLSNPAGPVVIWQGSRINLDFEGDHLTLCFDGLQGQNFFNVQVDDSTVALPVPVGVDQRFEYPANLAPGRHHLTLFKRSEANAGNARFKGVEIAAGAHAWAPAPPAYKLAMEFFGDSITVGACNEDGDTDQWDNRQTHNNALSWAALTASAFSADYRNIAVSGMGVVTGYVSVKAGEIWDRLYPEAKSPPADLKPWQPDVAFVLLGENDSSFTSGKGQPFPTNFTAAYVTLVKSIRQVYPKAHIVLLRGGMYNGAQNPDLRRAWEAAVTQCESADPAISHFVFTHWTSQHPRVADDRQLAAELAGWLQTQSFLP